MKYTIVGDKSKFTRTPLTFDDLKASDLFMLCDSDNNGQVYMKLPRGLLSIGIGISWKEYRSISQAVSLATGYIEDFAATTKVKKFTSAICFNMLDFVETKEELENKSNVIYCSSRTCKEE